ncbi:MAG: Holliday junction resolvase [Thermoplasmata archaeon]|nr:Holliday junction resolvase [Thermoplasmata archaeon]
MSSGSSSYERELKELLQANPEALAKYGKSLPPSERPALEAVRRAPFLVVRAAGSLGFDLVAMRSEFAFPLEVKASASDTIRFSAASGRAALQLEQHRAAVSRVGLVILYAYRRVGRGHGEHWRLYAGGVGPSTGRYRVLNRWLPPVESTKEGNGVLRWDAGMPLSRFWTIIAGLTDPSPGAPSP